MRLPQPGDVYFSEELDHYILIHSCEEGRDVVAFGANGEPPRAFEGFLLLFPSVEVADRLLKERGYKLLVLPA